jgi:hypothetical protein
MKFEVCVSAERFDAKDVCVVWVRPTGGGVAKLGLSYRRRPWMHHSLQLVSKR